MSPRSLAALGLVAAVLVKGFAWCALGYLPDTMETGPAGALRMGAAYAALVAIPAAILSIAWLLRADDTCAACEHAQQEIAHLRDALLEDRRPS